MFHGGNKRLGRRGGLNQSLKWFESFSWVDEICPVPSVDLGEGIQLCPSWEAVGVLWEYGV